MVLKGRKKVNETTKIRDVAIKYCNGCGVDVGCGSEKIKQESFGVDSSIGDNEFRDLSCVNIKTTVTDMSLFNTGSLDFVYTSHFLEHLQDPKKMIDDMCRVLREGGYLVVYLPDRVLYTEPNPDHFNMWTLEEFKKIVPDFMVVVDENPKHDYSFFVAFQKKEQQ
jgi:SAM-dependent methyltransferase